VDFERVRFKKIYEQALADGTEIRQLHWHSGSALYVLRCGGESRVVGDLDYLVAGGRDGAKAKAPKFQPHDDDSMWIFPRT
jgi:hypothetical protein